MCCDSRVLQKSSGVRAALADFCEASHGPVSAHACSELLQKALTRCEPYEVLV